jgi:uncharacterized protein with PIN domain
VKIKLDEHLGSVRVATWLGLAGHDVATVREQGLTSTPDEQLIEICTSEARCLITNDRGFSNRMKYNPYDYAGIIVIRLPSHHNFDDLREAIDTLIIRLEEAEVMGKLWIVKSGSVQEYQAIEPDV